MKMKNKKETLQKAKNIFEKLKTEKKKIATRLLKKLKK